MAGLVVLAFGLFTLVGGIIGYAKAKSTASLVTGAVSGLLLLACAYGLGQGSRLAAAMSLVVSALVGARFVGTWRRRHRLMPDLLMVLFSIATLLAVSFSLVD